MESLLVLAVVIFAILPIVSVIVLFSIRSRIEDIELSLREMRRLVSERLVPAAQQTEDIAPQQSPEGETEIPAESVFPTPQAQPLAPPAAETAYQAESVSFAPEGIVLPQAELTEPALTAADDDTQEAQEKTVSADEPSRIAQIVEARRETAASWVTSRLKRLSTWLIAEGNIWVTVGVMLFLAGFGLLFNYVVRRHRIPLELRLVAGAAVSIAMTWFGWKMRNRRRTYALILQGGGIALLYVVLLAGVRMGPVIPAAVAIAGMIMLSTFSVALALLQDFELLAIFALLGGYMAPILLSTGSSNFVALFSIYSLLNAEILLISLWRDWRKTRWGGLLASAAVGAIWGALRWRDEYFSSAEPFLILFFVNYSAIALIPLFRDRLAAFVKSLGSRPGEFTHLDMPMIAALPFVMLSLQMAAASHTRYGVALTCLALGAWHLALGRHAVKRDGAGAIGIEPRLFLVYCLIFSNLAVPFIFRQALSSCVWAIEGTLLAAYAARHRHRDRGVMICGILLHAFAFLLYNFAPFLHLPGHLYAGIRPAVALLRWRDLGPDFLLTALVFAASALAAGYFAHTMSGRGREKNGFLPKPAGFRDALPWAFAAYGTAWWTMAAIHAADFYLGGTPVGTLMMLCLGALAAYEVSERAQWPQIRVMAIPAFGAMLRDVMRAGLSRASALDWLTTALMSFRAYLSYRDGGEAGRARKITWGVTLFITVLYSSWSWTGLALRVFGRDAAFGSGGMLFLASFLPVVLAALLFVNRRFGALAKVKMEDYAFSSAVAVTALMALRLWYFCGTVFDVDVSEQFFPYIPLLNPMELWQALYIATAGIVLYELEHERVRTTGLYVVLPVVVFLWLNSVAARTAWEWFGETVRLGRMARAPYFQGIIAILWGFTALALIGFGKKYANRRLWFIGAGLLAADIAKLLLVDLRNSATAIRILAFLLLGGLFLLIGWTSPLPPRKKSDMETESGEGAGDP
ncbi:MAG: DUF2339 domain-containing protein [Synergistaceae bacterium]|jgi:uncharacterized membrane protein|nr:DUF2339 domain-containing protein [Synergistaceae bacterium]